MSAPETTIFVAGLNAARIFGLSSGYLAGVSPAAYMGFPVGGPITLELTVGDPTYIVHPGNNGICQQDMFPTADPTSGVLNVSRLDYATIAFLKNIKVATVGDINMIGWGTSQDGKEPTVALVAYQQGKLTTGDRGWHTYVIPRCVIMPKPNSMINRDRDDLVYNIGVQRGTQHLTGIDFSLSVDGYKAGDIIDLESNYRVAFAGFKSTANDMVFTLASDKPARADGIIKVSVNGGAYLVEGVGAGKVVSTTTGFTLGTATVTGDYVSAMYELSNDSDDLV